MTSLFRAGLVVLGLVMVWLGLSDFEEAWWVTVLGGVLVLWVIFDAIEHRGSTRTDTPLPRREP
ncbi:hypothetical protein ACF1BU_35250 [Streptomyces sp. NPDC014724]|uniref:hypothetical protein n=1 Tax=Actinomycetes TaxID=1760 RepID=UPI000761FCCB|nr:hypothetical protein [Nocardia farcinica]